jgi:hypothetical protein
VSLKDHLSGSKLAADVLCFCFAKRTSAGSSGLLCSCAGCVCLEGERVVGGALEMAMIIRKRTDGLTRKEERTRKNRRFGLKQEED